MWNSPERRFTVICSLVLLTINLPDTDARALVNGRCPSENKTGCYEGVFLDVWEPPSTGLTLGDTVARATVYLGCLVYMFLGVSIIADRFMSSIEVITSQEKEVTIKKKNGEKQVVSVRIWNETVSNLTLMALGSSAPEILLSIIEIIGKKFNAGDLGPGTIVGSAAFNLFVIIGVCVIVIPDGDVRRIKHLGVFFITATFSIFAYLWLWLIIAKITPRVVDVWEALLTLLFFPITVILAYIADTKIFFKRFLQKKYKATGIKAFSQEVGGDMEMQANNHSAENGIDGYAEEGDEVHDFEKHRMEYIDVIREIRKKHPNIDMKSLEEMAQLEVLNRGPKSRAYYRMQATRQLTGSGKVINKAKLERRMSQEESQIQLNPLDTDPIQKVFFDPGHYTVMENIGTFYATVTRAGGDLMSAVQVDFETEDGTANAGEDYEYTRGSLCFQPGETHRQIAITIIDDDIFEEDEHFYIHLSSPRLLQGGAPVELMNPSTATVMVLDDDHGGIFHFEEKSVRTAESVGQAEIKVQRSSGARGHVRIPYQTIDGTAYGNGKDYEHVEGFLDFHNDQSEAIIYIPIIDDNDYEKNEYFYVQLGDPVIMKKRVDSIATSFFRRVSSAGGQSPNEEQDALTKNQEIEDMGKPRLGEITRVEVHIMESMEFKNTVDHLLKTGKWSLMVGTSSWREQFIEAITVQAGGDDDNMDDEDAEEKLPSCMDYVMHFLTLFWKVLFAFVPPTDYVKGWLCFCVSIIVIGVLTAFIGDFAAGFGCTVGLTDAVTAITFVALGTSVPDMFASKVAAIGDPTADSSIGNVTGSNAVNVFLGIGIAWTIATVYHYFKGTTFDVEPGSLGFSVTVFCIFAFFAICLLVARRRPSIGGELGGPKIPKYITACCLFTLWISYVIISSLENYCHIEGF